MSDISHIDASWSAMKPDGSNGYWTITAASGEQIATVWSVPNGTEEANARLIAAAPEMADVLRPQLSPAMRKRIEETIAAEEAVGDRKIAVSLRFLLEREDAAKAVIAKAEGR